jgi:multidrug efflux pump subunit AcrB
MNTLSTLVGSNYEISFIKYGINYKVIVQASPEYRALPGGYLETLCENDRDEMVPYSAFMKLEKKYMDYQRLLDTICTLPEGASAGWKWYSWYSHSSSC